MNITIILPAVHVTSKRQQRDESPQPTTPFPPISITPSPTPFSEMTSYNPEDYKDIIESYDREMEETHLSKSRAEIVARQAAYEDIHLSRSASSTPGTVISRCKSSSESPPLIPGKSPGLGGSAPCPYCSSDSKSEPSLKSLPEKIVAQERRGSSVVLPTKEFRETTATSMSIERNTESPSSVDTVNTVIQSKAFDILGNLKQNGDIGSTLDDSFESLGNDIYQDDDDIKLTEELEEPQQDEVQGLQSSEMQDSSTFPVTASGEVAKEAMEQQNILQVNHTTSSPVLLEDCLFEEEEEEEDEGVVLPLAKEEEVEQFVPEFEEASKQTDAEEAPVERKSSPCEDLVPERIVDTPTKQQLLGNLSVTSPLCDDQPPASPEPTEEEVKIMQRQEQKVQQQEHEESALQMHELHLKEKETQQLQQAVPQEEPEVATALENIERESTPVQEDQEQKEVEMSPTTTTTTESQNAPEEAKVLPEEDEEVKPEAEEKREPVTEESGNDEVTIIVTQDDMPPANMFDSDSEPDLPAYSTEPHPPSSFSPPAEEEKPIICDTEPETDVDLADPLYSSKSCDFYSEEITSVIHEDSLKASDSAYLSHHELESYYTLEKISDNFTYSESYAPSEKSEAEYEKDFETESGYDDFDRSYGSHNTFDTHKYAPLDTSKMHRQHTLSDIPLLPMKKSPMTMKKQKTEDYTSTTQQMPLLLKRKPKPYPDPRKPAAYPQRLNKTTLARQALAREKRRIYVEERIQNFMRNTKSIQTPYGSLDRSYSIDRSNKMHQSYSMSKLASDAKRYEKLGKQAPQLYRNGKIESPQSLPDISIIDYYMAPSRGLLTSTPVGGVKSHLSSSMSSIRSPTIGVAEVSVVGSSGGSGRTGPPPRQTSQRSGIVIDSIPEETSDFWKAISSEEGYFYTFRVRQTGPVQMVDKAVQTGPGPITFAKEFCPPVHRKRHPVLSKSSTITLPLIDNRDKILREIAETVQLRHDAELRRAELIQRANDLQTLIKEKRDKINRRHEFWHKKYIEESSMTRPLEAACNSLRAELNTVHRRLLAHLEGRDLPLRLRDGPSKKANYKIMAARLQHEIKELQQKAKAAKLRLESEIKLKEQAEREVRELRNDLAHKKVIMSLARSQIAALPTVHPRGYDPLGY